MDIYEKIEQLIKKEGFEVVMGAIAQTCDKAAQDFLDMKIITTSGGWNKRSIKIRELLDNE